jgi:DNA-binding transcriptional ArsR family regulator
VTTAFAPKSTASDARVEAIQTAKLVNALNNPIRRAILRFLLKKGPSGSKHIHRGIPIFGVGNNIRHHYKVLVDSGAITREPGRGRGQGNGSEGAIYAINTPVSDSPWVIGVLETTAPGDS